MGALAANTLTWALAGGAIGAGAGLVPGLHPNTIATGALLVALEGWLTPERAIPLLSGMLGAWTFANAIPLVVLGVPDGDDAPALLPGQRLAQDGKAAEAIHASARGSVTGLVAGAALALVLAWSMARVDLEPALQAATPWIQGGALLVLVATDPAGPVRALVVAVLAGALGHGALSLPVSSPIGLPATPLAPLFIGLFGLPALANAARSGPPREPFPGTKIRRVRIPGHAPGLVGSALGLLAGTFSGFTSGPATAVAVLVRGGRPASVLATTAAVNTSAACVATAMLHAATRTRTGVHATQLALAVPDPSVAALAASLTALALGGVLGLAAMVLAARSADPIAGTVPRIAPALVVVWLAVIGAQTGLAGFGIAAAAWTSARAASALGTRRSVLMAALLVPGLLDALAL